MSDKETSYEILQRRFEELTRQNGYLISRCNKLSALLEQEQKNMQQYLEKIKNYEQIENNSLKK